MNTNSKLIQKLILGFLLSGLLSMTSCRSQGFGCEATAKYQVGVDKKGKLSNKKGKSNLFSKKKRRKMKSGKRN